MERLSLKVLNNALNVMETIKDCCGGFGDSLEECKYEFLKQHKHFLELQEQGRLLELPCAVGDTIYEPTYDRMAEPQYFIAESSVLDVSAKGVWIAEDCFDGWENLGKTYFLDRKEADEALKRMVNKQ